MRTEFEKFSKRHLNRSKWYRKFSPRKFTSFMFKFVIKTNKKLKTIIHNLKYELYKYET